MPSKNVLRCDSENAYYHVYARGIGKAPVFLCSDDKDYFLYLLSRHLSSKSITTKAGYTYPSYRGEIELLSYCLMANHFHLLLYQHKLTALSRLMKSVITGYVAYFNRKYLRTGPLFESRFKAALIDGDKHLAHISRYIHLNPRSWRHFPHSSLSHIRSGIEPEWLQTEKILEDFSSREEYLQFVADYEDHKNMLEEIKHELADT